MAHPPHASIASQSPASSSPSFDGEGERTPALLKNGLLHEVQGDDVQGDDVQGVDDREALRRESSGSRSNPMLDHGSSELVRSSELQDASPSPALTEASRALAENEEVSRAAMRADGLNTVERLQREAALDENRAEEAEIFERAAARLRPAWLPAGYAAPGMGMTDPAMNDRALTDVAQPAAPFSALAAAVARAQHEAVHEPVRAAQPDAFSAPAAYPAILRPEEVTDSFELPAREPLARRLRGLWESRLKSPRGLAIAAAGCIGVGALWAAFSGDAPASKTAPAPSVPAPVVPAAATRAVTPPPAAPAAAASAPAVPAAPVLANPAPRKPTAKAVAPARAGAKSKPARALPAKPAAKKPAPTAAKSAVKKPAPTAAKSAVKKPAPAATKKPAKALPRSAR